MSSFAEQAKQRFDDQVERLSVDMVKFLARYITQPSVNAELGGEATEGQELASQSWLAEQLAAWGVFPEVDLWEAVQRRPNIAVQLPGAGDGRDILLNGHNDVVPIGDEAAWSVDPWGGIQKDGCIYGRGATDMKGGTTAFLFAMRALASAGVSLSGTVTGTVVSGEESGNRRVGPEAILERGYQAPLCIVAEPTNLRVAAAISGELYSRLRVPGRAAHLANRPEAVWPHEGDISGVNAIEKMFKLLRALWELERDWGLYVQHPAMPPGRMTLNVATVSGGAYISALAEECEAVFSVLFPPTFSVQAMAEELRQVIDRAAMNDLWLRDHPPELFWPHVVPGKEPVDLSEHAAVPVLDQAFRTALGQDAQHIYASFTSDANFLADIGQPALMLGPGDLSMGAHAPDEYIPVDQVIDAVKVFGHFIIDWCGIDAAG